MGFCHPMWMLDAQYTRKPFFTLLISGFLIVAAGAAESPMNVLLIVVDDLRTDEAGLLQTPNIDTLASQGISFTRAYSAVPVCGASASGILERRFSRTWTVFAVQRQPYERHHSARYLPARPATRRDRSERSITT